MKAATYDYDAEGRRVKRTASDGTATYYVYDADGQLMAEYGGVSNGAGTQYLATDHLGSTRMVQDAQGNCTVRMDYAPYGALVARAGQDCYASPWTEGQMFTGALRDGATDLDHMGAREHYATLGRFISPDQPLVDQHPADPQSWNLYAYARNNPLRYVDPTGMAFCSYGSGGVPEGGPATEEKACTEGGGTWVYQPTDTDDPNADAPTFQFTTTTTEYTGELSPSGQAVVADLDARADASNQFIALFAAGSVVAGGVAGLVPVAGQALNEVALGPAAGRVFYHFSRIGAAGAAGRLIDNSPAGRLLHALPLSEPVKNAGWNLLSRFWASGASGTVKVFPEMGRRSGELYKTELPRLMSNPFVHSIQYR